MDERFRRLEHAWQLEGQIEDLNRLLAALLRISPLEGWELAAEEGDSQALAYISLLRQFDAEGPLTSSEALMHNTVYVNVYEDFSARSTVECPLSQLTEVRRWLRHYYSTSGIFYTGREVYDISLQKEIYDPAAKLTIESDVEPCFYMYPGDIMKRANAAGISLINDEDSVISPALLRNLTPDNLHGTRERYVSFQLIEDYELNEQEGSAEEEPESRIAILPQWINIYATTNNYGGPQEGGWYFLSHNPITSIYIGQLPADVLGDYEYPILSVYHGALGYSVILSAQYQLEFSNFSIPDHIQRALDFASQLHEGITEGDIYSVNGGSYLDIRIQTHPAVREPFFKPYYS